MKIWAVFIICTASNSRWIDSQWVNRESARERELELDAVMRGFGVASHATRVVELMLMNAKLEDDTKAGAE